MINTSYFIIFQTWSLIGSGSLKSDSLWTGHSTYFHMKESIYTASLDGMKITQCAAVWCIYFGDQSIRSTKWTRQRISMRNWYPPFSCRWQSLLSYTVSLCLSSSSWLKSHSISARDSGHVLIVYQTIFLGSHHQPRFHFHGRKSF